MLRFFEHPLSPYARKVKICLYEKGIPFERVFVNPLLGPTDPVFREFRERSPLVEVPCLVDGDLAIHDSTIQLEYVEERWPGTPVQPADPGERARVRMLEEICDTQLEATNWGLMELRFFRRAEGEEAAAILARAGAQLEALRTRLERELDGRPWMNGERFGRGDAAVVPHIAGSAFFGFPLDPAAHPTLAAWYARCGERESVKRDAADVSAFLKGDGARSPGSGAPPIVRQYRDHRLEWMMRSGGVEVVRRGLANGTIRFSTEIA